MITLNDYLYSGDTVLRILKKYIADLRISAVQKHNEVDLVHCNFLIQIMKLLEHNDFPDFAIARVREFYIFITATKNIQCLKNIYLIFQLNGQLQRFVNIGTFACHIIGQVVQVNIQLHPLLFVYGIVL